VAENGDRWKTVRRMQSTMATTGGSPSFATTMWMTAHNFLSAVHHGSVTEPRLPWAEMVLVLGFDSEVGRVGVKSTDGNGLGAASTQNTIRCRIASLSLNIYIYIYIYIYIHMLFIT
jgi:hypothetical protein